MYALPFSYKQRDNAKEVVYVLIRLDFSTSTTSSTGRITSFLLVFVWGFVSVEE